MMLDFIDSMIDRVTMYRLLIYYLLGLLLAAVALSQLGYLHYKPLNIIFSAGLLVGVCWVTNKIFSNIFNAPTNSESSIITALILALIITPVNSGNGIMFLLAASGLAIASKYLLTINKKHIFNPAAVAVVLTALGPKQSASWWVGTAYLLPFVLVGGVILLRKIRKFHMIFIFLGTTFLATVLYTVMSRGNVLTSINQTILSSAIFFLAFVMLTEPATSPTTNVKQKWYAGLVGILFPPQVHILAFYSSPEIALVIGNIFSYIVSPKIKLFTSLKEKNKISSDSLDFVFHKSRKINYKPGQYMEWTLPHKDTDSRGDRRYFTLASSPTENDIRIGVKFYERSSSYKRALLKLSSDTPIVASQIAGDFVLPKDESKKLVFIAGGIGVTPYRSMVKYLIDKNQKRSITIVYSAKDSQGFMYKQLFEEARKKLNINTIYHVTNQNSFVTSQYVKNGQISSKSLTEEVPDYKERYFYISGTHTMVTSIRKILREIGVSNTHIKVDFFSGYS